MALSKLFYTQANYVLPYDMATLLSLGKSFNFALKAFLKGEITATTGTSGAPPVGSRWTHVKSSDGVSVSTVTDLWTATFDVTKIVTANNGTAHSWIILQSPTGICGLGFPLYLLISMANHTAAGQCRLVLSKGAFTGGTFTNDPIAGADFVQMPDPGTAQAFTLGAATGSTNRMTFVTDAVGNFFVTAQSPAYPGLFYALVGVQSLTEIASNDVYPYFLFGDAVNSGRGAGNCGVSQVLTQNFGVTGCYMKSFDGSLSTRVDGAGSGLLTGGNQQWYSRTTVNEGTGLHDVIPVLKYYVATNNTASIRGKVADWWMGNNGRSVGAVEPATGITEHMLVGSLYLPNGGVAPII